MLAVAFGNGVMAGRAGIVAHIVHPRPDIPVARRILLRCLSSMVLALPALPQPFAGEDESRNERQDRTDSDSRDDESCSPGAAGRVGHVAHATGTYQSLLQVCRRRPVCRAAFGLSNESSRDTARILQKTQRLALTRFGRLAMVPPLFSPYL